VGLLCENLEKSLEFYCGLLGEGHFPITAVMIIIIIMIKLISYNFIYFFFLVRFQLSLQFPCCRHSLVFTLNGYEKRKYLLFVKFLFCYRS